MTFSTVFQYSFPTTIRFGAGSSKELGAYLLKNNLLKPLIVTDPTVAQLDFFREILTDLQNKKISVEVFHDIHKNPVRPDVYNGGDVYDATNRDAIIGIGGGAALDVARAIALRIHHRGDLFTYDDLVGGDIYVTNEIPHFVTIPTTAGTGSEVGRSAIISDEITHQKKILFSPKLLAKIVFADPLLTMELPPFITAATGMDALTHNMEAFLAKMVHPMCDGIALEGISLIHQSLERAVNRPDLESRSKMLIASLMGAVAFQKGLGVVIPWPIRCHLCWIRITVWPMLSTFLTGLSLISKGLNINLKESPGRWNSKTKAVQASWHTCMRSTTKLISRTNLRTSA